MDQENKRTCLYDRHVALGALISPFGGFDMPIQYLEKCDFSYNKEVADELGIEIPADLIK